MTGSTLKVAFTATCQMDNNKTEEHPFTVSSSYPYRLEDAKYGQYVCNESHPQDQGLLQGAASAAQFYVFVGVMVFLYCLAALILYIFFDQTYRKHNACTIGDLIVSGVITLLWLISSSAWASGVTDLKYYTDLAQCGYFQHLHECAAPNSCSQTLNANFASLNVSIIFGFLNMLVWAGNVWFAYKETPWHKVTQSKATPPGSSPGPTDQQRI